MVEGYHLYVGGGCGPEQGIGRELFRDVVAGDVGPVLERIFRAYQERRRRRRRGPDGRDARNRSWNSPAGTPWRNCASWLQPEPAAA